MKSKSSKVLVLDICGTLYKGNSTLDFIDFLKFKRPGRYMKFLALTLLIKLMKKIKCIKKNEFRAVNDKLETAFFVGEKINFLNEQGKIFWNQKIIENEINKEILNVSHNFDKVILASAAIPFLVEQLKDTLDFMLSIQREVLIRDNTIVSFSESILENKANVIREKFPTEYLVFYSDNIEDYDSRNLFDEFYYVKI